MNNLESYYVIESFSPYITLAALILVLGLLGIVIYLTFSKKRRKKNDD